MAGMRSSQISYIVENSVKHNLKVSPTTHNHFPEPTPEVLLAKFESTPKITTGALRLGKGQNKGVDETHLELLPKKSLTPIETLEQRFDRLPPPLPAST